jgi:hypothetical protein
MTVENALEIEVKRAESLIDEIRKIFPNLSEDFPTWADVGEVKRFNSMLDEIVKIYQYQK